MPNVNLNINTDNTLEFTTLRGTVIQLIDEQLLYEDGELLPYVSPNEAYDEYYYLLDNERDAYLQARVRKSDD
jgi:hypothetical protein